MNYDIHFKGTLEQVRPDLTVKEIASILVEDDEWAYYYNNKTEMLEDNDKYIIYKNCVYLIKAVNNIQPKDDLFELKYRDFDDIDIDFDVKFNKNEHCLKSAIKKALNSL